MTNSKVFRTIPDLCTGCMTCELMCSLKKTGRVNPAYARITIHRSLEDGECTPTICRHCKVPLCQKACQVPDAMFEDKQTSAIVIDEKKCTGCRACADACPFNAIQIGPEGEVLKCDLCGGDPVCVKYCQPRPSQPFPHLAYPWASCLEYVERNKVTRKQIISQ